MAESSAREDVLTLSGLGGLYNGEVFALRPGESATIGATSLATFPVTLCRNYRRLADDPSREEILTRLAPEHARFLYVGEGRLVVENLAGRDVFVGRGAVDTTTEVDLTAGRIEIEFAYGERIVASVPDSPPEFLEFADARDEDAEVEGVFMALLSPEGPLAAVRDKLREEDREYELLPEEDEPDEPADPAAETGPIPPVTPPPRGKPKRKRWFRPGPGVLFSLLVHLVVILGLFAWIRARPEPGGSRIARVAVRSDAAPAPRPDTPPPDAPAPVPDDTRPAVTDPTVHEREADVATRPGGAPGDAADAGRGESGGIGLGSGGMIAGPGGAGPVFAAGMESAGGTGFRRRDLDLALDWLARHQREDGSWRAISSLSGCSKCTGPGRREYPVAMTGLALLAFSGAGHTHRAGDHRETVTAGLRWLAARQEDDGSFHLRSAPEEVRPLYGDSIATLALAEIYRQSRSPLLRLPLTRGAGFLVAAQNPYAGWRYRRGDRESDTSVTGWATLALVAAGEAGVSVNPAARFGAVTWVEDVTDPVSFRVGYRERGRGSLGMTATGLAIRLFAGQDPGEEAVRKGARYLEDNPPAWPEGALAAPAGNPPDLLYFYFGSLASGRLSRAEHRRFAGAVRDALGPHQVRSGEARGSFPPEGRWSRVGGRVFATALAALTLTRVLDSPSALK